MLTLFTSAGAVPLRCDDYYIRELASGLDELEFHVSIWDEQYQLIQEEVSIREQSDDVPIDYLVKAIDGGSETATIKCQIDLDAWKQTLTVGYNSGSLTVGNIVRAVAPSGWAVADQSGMTYRRTIELESATPLDVLEQCRDTFSGVSFRFDNVSKTVTIVNMSAFSSIGAFVTRNLNLRQNNYKGKSTGFITRLYAYGKDGMTFSSINDGKPYVDNNTYSSRVICGYWKDERYTVAANLLQAAQEKLAALAIPARSYECDVVDLAATDPSKYGYLDFQLYTIVTLIDETRSGAKIEHRVVERWRYPYLPQNNKVVLATSAPRIQSQLSQIINSVNNPNSVWAQQQRTAQENAIANATAQITGARGGNMRAIYDSSGNWTELVVMNTDDILTASKLWRFNLGGFGYSPNGYNGPYTTAITMDGAIVADFITTGTLDASLATVVNLNASNISTGTLSAARIAAHSIAVGKLSGSLSGGLSSSWGIDFDTGTLTIGNISAANITTGTLSADRIAANSIAVSKLTGSISNGSWEINLTAGTMTIGTLSASRLTAGTIDANTVTVTNLNASNISSGTLSADRLAANSIAVSKLTGTISNSGWSIDLTNGTMTIGTLSADNINGGTINASTINVTNLNASNLTSGTLPSARVADQSIAGGKLVNNAITVTQLANGAVTGAKVDYQTLTDTNVARYTLSGGSGGAIGSATLSSYNIDANLGSGIAGGLTASDVFAGNSTASYLYANYVRANTQMWFQGRQVIWQIMTIGGNTYYMLTGGAS